MNERVKWAFIIDQDEFVRFSLNKILQKYGFQVEEVEDVAQLEGREKDIRGGVILGDVEIEVLERRFSPFRKYRDRFILISPLNTDELTPRLKKIGIQHIVKKPVDPKMLRRMIRQISFPEGLKVLSPGKKKGASRSIQKGGEAA